MPSYYNNGQLYTSGLSTEPLQPQQMMGYQQYYPMTPPQYGQGYAAPPMPQQTQQSDDSDLKVGGFKFTIRKDNEDIPSDFVLTNSEPVTEEKKKRGRPRKEKTETIGSDFENKDKNGNVPTMYTYAETTNMLRGTLAQIDQLAGQVKAELDNVASSRTLKSKYNVMVGLSGNLSDILGQKISVIKEINNAISKSNEMDYKREKDMRVAENAANDDKYLMDMYNAFIQNPVNNPSTSPLGPSTQTISIGSDMGGAGSYASSDTGYLGYVANMTPEQRLMTVEDDPNIKQCVIYDAATGNKAFQWMDMSTNQPVSGLPARDPMFLEDTTIDLRNKIAKNINLNETYPVVVINENVISEY